MASIRSAQLPRSWKRSTCAEIRGEQLLSWADCALPVTALQVSSICRSTPPCSTESGSSRTPQGTRAVRSTTRTDHIQRVVYESHMHTAAASRTALRVCGGQQSLWVRGERRVRGGGRVSSAGLRGRDNERTRARAVHRLANAQGLPRSQAPLKIHAVCDPHAPDRSRSRGMAEKAARTTAPRISSKQSASWRPAFSDKNVRQSCFLAACPPSSASEQTKHAEAARISTPLSLHMAIHHARLS